jgi:predicted PurR-regulated permease PerM
VDDSRGRLLSSPFVIRIVRWGLVAWSVIGVLSVAMLFLRFVLYPIRVVFPPLVVAMVVVYLLNPIVRRLEPKVGRLWGAVITYLVFLSIMGVSLRFLIPAIADQVGSFAESVPALLARLQNSVNNLADRFDLNFSPNAIVNALGPTGGGGEFIGRIFSFTAGVLHVAVVAVLGPILAFYLLVDLPKIQRGIKALIPTRRRAEVESVLEKMGKALGGFFRGQLLVATFVGLASILVLWIVGLPYFALVGLICGLFNLIPLVGPFIAAVPALFIAFTTTSSGGLMGLEPGLPLAVGASVALLIVQQIDNHIISPNVVARTVKLHPVTVMLGLLVGGTLLGLWGMLLAVPLIAAVKILLLHYWDTRMHWPPTPAEVSADVAKTDPAGDGIPVEPANGRRKLLRTVRKSTATRRPRTRSPKS